MCLTKIFLKIGIFVIEWPLIGNHWKLSESLEMCAILVENVMPGEKWVKIRS